MITNDFGSLDESGVSIEGIEELWGYLNFKIDVRNIGLLFESLLEENPYAGATYLYCSKEINNFDTVDVVFGEKKFIFKRLELSIPPKTFCLIVAHDLVGIFAVYNDPEMARFFKGEIDL